MSLTSIQQLQQLLEPSKYILVLFPSKNNGDAVASALALKLFLEKQHKQVDVAASGFVLPKQIRFLTGSDSIQPELEHLQKFILKVDISRAPIDTISYDVKDNWLSIYLTPQHGAITKNELRTSQSTFKYDLIITLGAPDLEALGDIFFNNTDLFYKVPIINFDFQPNNERFGQVHFVDPTATSTAEIVYRALKQLNEPLLDAAMATTLLTGMTIATKSFKNPHLTPVTLQLASELIKSGADREQIVQHLYHTRTLSTLKLWGQALSHLQNDSASGLVWTTLTRDDFVRSGSSPEELPGIVDELITSAPEAKIILLLYEIDVSKIRGLLAVEKNYDAMLLAKPLSPEGNKRQAVFTVEGKTLKEAEEMVLKTIRGNNLS